MISVFSQTGGGSFAVMKGVYFTSFVWTSRKYFHASSTSSGRRNISRAVRAITFAPAVAPLCAIGVAIAIALAQWCAGGPGMFDGKPIVTVGTTHEMSPISSEPPLERWAGGPESVDAVAVTSPV